MNQHNKIKYLHISQVPNTQRLKNIFKHRETGLRKKFFFQVLLVYTLLLIKDSGLVCAFSEFKDFLRYDLSQCQASAMKTTATNLVS